MKTVRVVAAVLKTINQNGKPIIFATQRGYGEFKGQWEFPGEKIEEGETPEQALKREIKEELDSVQWLPADIGLISKIKDEMLTMDWRILQKHFYRKNKITHHSVNNYDILSKRQF